MASTPASILFPQQRNKLRSFPGGNEATPLRALNWSKYSEFLTFRRVFDLAILDNCFDELSLNSKKREEKELGMGAWLLAYQAILASSSSSIIILDLTLYKNYSLSK